MGDFSMGNGTPDCWKGTISVLVDGDAHRRGWPAGRRAVRRFAANRTQFNVQFSVAATSGFMSVPLDSSFSRAVCCTRHTTVIDFPGAAEEQ